MENSNTTTVSSPEGQPAPALGVAWDHFYAYCAETIRRCPNVRKLSDADREDCVQEVMFEIVRKFGEHRPEALREGIPGWIKTVSRNKAVDIVRRRFRRPEVGFDDGSGEALVHNGRGGGGAEAPDLERGEYVSLVWEALLSLDQKVTVTSYLVFYMHAIEGWSVGEVAELFQLTDAQARARCHRVKTKFDEIVKNMGGPRPF